MATLKAGGRIAGGVVLSMYSTTKIAKGLGVELCGVYKVQLPAAVGSRNVIGQVIAEARADGEDMAVECRGTAVQTMKSGAALGTCGPVVLDTAGKVIAFVPPTATGLTAVQTLLAELRTDFIAHCALVGDPACHTAADATNNNPAAIASGSLADLITAANSLKTKFNAHDTETGASHIAAGPALQVDAPNATDLDSLIYLVNDIKAAYELHRVNTTIHTTADATNVIAAPNAAKDFSETHSDASIYGWNLTTTTDADQNVDILVK